MYRQVQHWMEILGTGADIVLLLRILLLRLHRTYILITLACALTVFFDGVMLWLGVETEEFARVFIYSRFLYAFVFPAATYDVWEEVKALVARVRRMAILRLVSSLVLAAIFGLLIASFSGEQDSGNQAVLNTFAIILWAASSTASLAFLWSMHRVARSQGIALPNNTGVWLLFYELSLAGEVVACFLIIIGPQLKGFAINAIDISLGLFGILIVLWCTWKLQGLRSDVPSAPEQASS